MSQKPPKPAGPPTEDLRGLEVFVCPAKEYGGCKLTRMACARRHLTKILVGKPPVPQSPSHLKPCGDCKIGEANAAELQPEMKAAKRNMGNIWRKQPPSGDDK